MSEHDAAVAIDRFFDDLAPEVADAFLNFHGGGEPTVALGVMRSAWRLFRGRAEELGLRAHAGTITNGAFGKRARSFLSEPGIEVLFSFDGPRQAAQRPTAGGRDSRARVVENMSRARGGGASGPVPARR